METEIKTIQVEIPKFSSKEELSSFIQNEKEKLSSIEDSIKMLIWCTDFDRVKPKEKSIIEWVGACIDNIFGKQNTYCNTFHQILILEECLKNLSSTEEPHKGVKQGKDIVVTGYKIENKEKEDSLEKKSKKKK